MTAQYEQEYSESLGQHLLIWLIINHTHWHEKNAQTILRAWKLWTQPPFMAQLHQVQLYLE